MTDKEREEQDNVAYRAWAAPAPFLLAWFLVSLVVLLESSSERARLKAEVQELKMTITRMGGSP